MPVESMTGFSFSKASIDGNDITCEIRSVNSKFLDITFKALNVISRNLLLTDLISHVMSLPSIEALEKLNPVILSTGIISILISYSCSM